ncbi:hypothetical protein EXIGLDRAFT_131689 [Exidia glandulosa HHB12029]|uniref:Uncharacterized protein n=1 Tax=Exidia glandulosa HHB12029 TaxID=1314781 RepID=A0A165G3L5_EXIGL|nr:hypothetical protein EXIGLDRAFT_131689 [Exidia glandulosa HHB12029]
MAFRTVSNPSTPAPPVSISTSATFVFGTRNTSTTARPTSRCTTTTVVSTRGGSRKQSTRPASLDRRKSGFAAQRS